MYNPKKQLIENAAGKYIKILNTDIKKLEIIIINELRSLYPYFDQEECVDWACEIMNCDSKDDVPSVFDRIESRSSFSA
jgi:hypothetical protein